MEPLVAQLSPWDFRLGSQLACAFQEFQEWCRLHGEEHTIKRFSCRNMSMYTKSSFPEFRNKAHNTLVLTRWLEQKTNEFSSLSEYNSVVHLVFWSWVEFFQIHGHSTDANWLSGDELARSAEVCEAILAGSNYLCQVNSSVPAARWKLRPKFHRFFHLHVECQQSQRPCRAFWSFKCEEGMGKLSKIGCATHALTLSERSLQRWLIQFFSWAEQP